MARVLRFGVLTLLVCAVVLLGFAFFRHEIAEADTSDLAPDVLPPLDDAENGYFELPGVRGRSGVRGGSALELWGDFKRFLELEPFGESWDESEARELVARNRSILRAVDCALERPRLRQIGEDDRLVPLSLASRLSAMRVRLLADRSRLEAATEKALQLLTLSERLLHAGGDGLAPLRSGLFLFAGTEALAFLVLRHDLDTGTLERAAEFLAEHVRKDDGFDAFLRREFAAASRVLEEGIDWQDWEPTLSGVRFPRLRFCVRCTHAHLAELFRVRRRNLGLPAKHRVAVPASLPGTSWHNAAGRRFRDVFASLDASRDYDERRFHLDALRILIALVRHERAHGERPETLDALVPEFLPAVPADPFDGLPLAYSRADGIVWSRRVCATSDGALRASRCGGMVLSVRE